MKIHFSFDAPIGITKTGACKAYCTGAVTQGVHAIDWAKVTCDRCRQRHTAKEAQRKLAAARKKLAELEATVPNRFPNPSQNLAVDYAAEDKRIAALRAEVAAYENDPTA